MIENQLARRLPLDGRWQLTLNDLRREVAVPGAWEVQGFPRAAAGVAHYRRAVVIPAEWAGSRVHLWVGAVSYAAEVFVNDAPVGMHEGMWAGFDLDISAAVRFGESNTIELRVVKPGRDGDAYPYRAVLSGFVPYAADTFGGIWQSAALVAHAHPAWERVLLRPDWATGVVQVEARITPPADAAAAAEVLDAAGNIVARAEHTFNAPSDTLQLDLLVPDPANWSPASPTCYTLRLTLMQAGAVVAQTTRTFGFRQVSAAGERLLLNGCPVHLRGALSWGWNPQTLAPVASDDELRALFAALRDHGFNLLKLCLFVPPPRWYEIADEEGMLLWLELPMWLPRLSDSFRQQARVEYTDIMLRDHHHPSLALVSLGCELDAEMADAALLSELDAIVRRATCGALVCDNSGSGEAYKGLSIDFADFSDYHFYADLHHFNPLLDHFHRDWRPARPWIFGEFCDKDDFRDLRAIQPDGVRLWWRDLEGIEGNVTRWAYIEQEMRMAQHDLPFDGAQIARISRQESRVVRKFILEQTRLRRFIGGYVVTGLRDTPIATSGIFDDHMQPKYDPADFRQFNSDVVLLLERGRTRVWRHGGDRPAPIDLYNHTAGERVDLRVVLAHVGRLNGQRARLDWRLSPAGSDEAISGGEQVTLTDVSPAQIAHLSFDAPSVASPEEWTLRVQVGDLGSQPATLPSGELAQPVSADSLAVNAWSLWFYPRVRWGGDLMLHDPLGLLPDVPAAPFDPRASGVLVTTLWTEAAAAFARAGGRVVALLASAPAALPTIRAPFWRESIKLLCPHPLLDRFPHRGCADLQFYSLATDCAIDTAALAAMPDVREVKPVIRRLDARLFTLSDYLLDFRLGDGHVLATTLRLHGGAGDQVHGLSANPAAAWLLAAMVEQV
jgi:hypothetical protein